MKFVCGSMLFVVCVYMLGIMVPAHLSESAYLLALGLAAIVLAIFVLGRKAAFIFSPPPAAEHAATISWSWRSTAWLLPTAAIAIWAIPVLYGLALGILVIKPVDATLLLAVLFIHILLVGIPEELFFRESGLSGWSSNPLYGMAVSSLAYFSIHLHQGIVPALIALGVGLVYCSLRIAGANVLAIGLLHGVTNVLTSQIVTLDLTLNGGIVYAFYLVAACAALSAVILYRSGIRTIRS